MIDQFFDYFGIQGGVLIVIGVGIVLFLIIAFVLERRTRIMFPERNKSDDDFDLFDFSDEDEEE